MTIGKSCMAQNQWPRAQHGGLAKLKDTVGWIMQAALWYASTMPYAQMQMSSLDNLCFHISSEQIISSNCMGTYLGSMVMLVSVKVKDNRRIRPYAGNLGGEYWVAFVHGGPYGPRRAPGLAEAEGE